MHWLLDDVSKCLKLQFSLYTWAVLFDTPQKKGGKEDQVSAG